MTFLAFKHFQKTSLTCHTLVRKDLFNLFETEAYYASLVLSTDTPISLNLPVQCTSSLPFSLQLRILEQAAGHLRWKVDYPPSQPVGSGLEPHWRKTTTG